MKSFRSPERLGIQNALPSPTNWKQNRNLLCWFCVFFELAHLIIIIKYINFTNNKSCGILKLIRRDDDRITEHWPVYEADAVSPAARLQKG